MNENSKVANNIALFQIDFLMNVSISKNDLKSQENNYQNNGFII
jgi:hypothetical protein